MKKLALSIIALVLMAATAQAQDSDKINLKPIIGASFGSIQHGEYDGSARISYWAGAYLKSLTPDITLWGAYQQTKIDDAGLIGKGGKALLVIKNKKYPDWRLMVGGGWLSNFAVNGDGTKTTAFDFDMGILYEWLPEQVYIGFLGSGADTGPRFDYSIDLGTLVTF